MVRNIFYIYCLFFDKDSKRMMVIGMKLESINFFKFLGKEYIYFMIFKKLDFGYVR